MPHDEDADEVDGEEDEIETEPCLKCGMLNYFPASDAGSTGECGECGHAIRIPTLKQYEYNQKQKTKRRQFLWWGAGAGGLLLLQFAKCAYDGTVSSPEQAYNNGYTWGSTVKQKGIDSATKSLRGTVNHPDYHAYQNNESLMSAFQHGLKHGLNGQPKEYLNIYGIP